MAKAGFCSVCNENVVLTEAGECGKAGHPVNCISGVYETEGTAAPAASPVAPTGKAAKPKKAWYKKWWIWVIVLLVLAGIGSNMGGGKGGSTTSSSAPTSPAASAPAQTPASTAAQAPAADQNPKIGTALKVGDLTFTVTSAKSTTKLTSPLGNKKGNWIVVSLKVKNGSKEAVTIDSSFFKLLAADGSAYETDSDNLMYLGTDSNFFLAKINPNLAKSGQALFAVPAGSKPADFKLQVQTGVFGTETGEIALTK